MVNIVAEEHAFHRILLFSPVSIIPSVPLTLPFIHNQCYRILALDVVVKKHIHFTNFKKNMGSSPFGPDALKPFRQALCALQFDVQVMAVLFL